jgi:NADH:ubiquinone oxidoreductase subunit B-like Fe-S oxidoreductase
VPGCPPSPEGLIYGILQLKEKVARDRAKMKQFQKRQVSEEPPDISPAASPTLTPLESDPAPVADASKEA